MQERRSNSDRSRETRRALLKAARTLFLAKGYAATGTPQVVEQAGVTRGALYHHFKDKQALFRAVVEAEAAAIAAEIDAGSSGRDSPEAALREGAKGYFRAMRRPGRVRLLLLEGPAVLGPAEMRRIDMQTGGRTLRHGLTEALGPQASAQRVECLADLLSAMFDRAALAGCDGGAGAEAYEEALAALLSILVRDRGATA